MAMFEFRVVPDEGEAFDLTAGMRDLVMWEKTHKGRGLAQVGDGLTASMIYEIAFSACRRQQLLPRELAEADFVAGYEVDVETAQEKAARLRAEELKRRIDEGTVPPDATVDELDDEPLPAGDVDPTHPGA